MRNSPNLRKEPQSWRLLCYPCRTHARGRAGRRSSCSFERSRLSLDLRRQALSFVQGPWIVAQLPTASGNTVLQPSWRPSDGQQISWVLCSVAKLYHWRAGPKHTWRATERRLHFDSRLRLMLVWIRIRVSMIVILPSSFQCGYVAFDLFFPFPKSNSASQYANGDWQRATSIVDLTAREPCRIFTFPKHVCFEHSTGIPCPVIPSRREGNINKQTQLKSFLTLDRRSVSPHRPACVRALRGQWAIWLAPRLP